MTTSPLKLPPDLERKVAMARRQTIADRETARLIMNCLDLTSLTGQETLSTIENMCNQAILYDLASVCVYPQYVADTVKFLRGTGIVTATVINYPFGNKRTGSDEDATPETTSQDISRAIAAGAAQIDIVQPHDVRPGYAQDILRAARIACPQHVTLKSILETASYSDTYNLADAALIAIASGADCLKTSTGKHPHGGATLEAAAILLHTVKKSGRNIGLKVTGGLKTIEDCAPYISLKRIFCGWNSIKPATFRFGGSQLLESLKDVFEQSAPTVRMPTTSPVYPSLSLE